jgi:hypothetical protein
MEPDRIRAFIETSSVLAEGIAEFDPLNVERLRRLHMANAERRSESRISPRGF